MSKQVIWPASKQAEAEAYADWTDVQFAILAPGEGTFAYPAKTKLDRHGQFVTAYFGPDFMWMGTEVPEPTSANPADDGPTQRADGVIAVPEWPDPE